MPISSRSLQSVTNLGAKEFQLQRPLSLALVLAGLLLSPSLVWAEPSLVVIVRHAERESEPSADPGLSGAGKERAAALALALQHANITSIFTTQFRRTRETAEPLARQRTITPQVIEARRGESAKHIADVADAVRQATGSVLVVGHSNTVADIVAALGGARIPNLCETSYGRAFVLVPGPATASLTQFRYGVDDPLPAAGCL